MRVMPIDVPALKVREEVENKWCYAAVEQVLRKAFKKPDISQTEIAHNCFLNIARKSTTTDGDLGRMLRYAKLAMAQATEQSVPNIEASWLDIRGALKELVPFGALDLDQDGLRDLLKACWGEFDRTIFTTRNIDTPPSTLDITSEIGEGKLVAAANQVHWYVIYGYDYDEKAVGDNEGAKYSYLVYDVHDGSVLTPKADDFNDMLTEVLTVAA